MIRLSGLRGRGSLKPGRNRFDVWRPHRDQKPLFGVSAAIQRGTNVLEFWGDEQSCVVFSRIAAGRGGVWVFGRHRIADWKRSLVINEPFDENLSERGFCVSLRWIWRMFYQVHASRGCSASTWPPGDDPSTHPRRGVRWSGGRGFAPRCPARGIIRLFLEKMRREFYGATLQRGVVECAQKTIINRPSRVARVFCPRQNTSRVGPGRIEGSLVAYCARCM